jgi:hypothetical protein
MEHHGIVDRMRVVRDAAMKNFDRGQSGQENLDYDARMSLLFDRRANRASRKYTSKETRAPTNDFCLLTLLRS